jgi:hypothetical protein
MRGWVIAVACVGCTAELIVPAYRCDVAIVEVAPTSASPGDAVAITGTPFTTSWDTAVYVGGTRAVVDAVNRDACETCDACFDEHDECLGGVCADCDACDALCNPCVERTTFVVPDVAAGETEVRVLNSHGESHPAPFTVLAKPIDTGDSGGETGDSDAPETGDSGKDDSGKKDDSGTTDSGDSSPPTGS